MKIKKLKIISWNVRGLGDSGKCNVVRGVIRESRADLVCFQESKLNESNLSYVLRALPTIFSTEVVSLDAKGTAGGCVIAWKRNYVLMNSWSTNHTISAVLEQTNTGQVFVVSNVYGPSVESEKMNFIQELRALHSTINYPWLLMGDFNLIRWFGDRSTDLRGFNLMSAFNDLIRDLGVIDVTLENRRYTWISKRPVPSFSKLDRVFISDQWPTSLPNIHLRAMELIVSDHVPLILSCAAMETRPRKFKFENFWTNYEQTREIVAKIWGPVEERSCEVEDDLTRRFSRKATKMHEDLRAWHRFNFGRAQAELMQHKEAILKLDRLEEERPLQANEFRIRQNMRCRAYELSNIIEERWRQRSRCKWLQGGDKNTAFFHAYASGRLRRNVVLSIKHNEQQVNDLGSIKLTFLEHMQGILGRAGKVIDFEPSSLYTPLQELQELQVAFTTEEISMAVSQLENNKASGPDGLTNEFLKVYWDLLKTDVMSMFQCFYNHNLDLTEINLANIVMVPKKEIADQVGDFWPISIINLIPKLISKVLGNRLKKWLPILISTNQSAFVQDRHIAETFISTRGIIQHLTASKISALFAKIDFSKAFDSISWSYLERVLLARGFPTRYVT